MSGRVLYNGGIVTNGLILRVDPANRLSYPGYENNLYDLSGNNNNGTLINGPSFSYNGGGSILFDGTDDYSNFGDKDIFSPSRISVFAFIKDLRQTIAIQRRLVSKDLCCNKRDWGLQLNSNDTISFTVWNQNGTISICEGGIAVNTDWNMVGGTWDGSTVKTFLNGVQQASSNLSGTSVNNTASNLSLGIIEIESPYSQQFHFRGYMGVVLIYNRALSDSEIIQNYNALKGRYGL